MRNTVDQEKVDSFPLNYIPYEHLPFPVRAVNLGKMTV